MAKAKKIESNSGFLADFGQKRLLTHLGLFGFTILGIIATYLYESTSQLNDILSLGTGYVSLILLVVTLSIGTLNLVLKRKNPVNVNFRRDVGIWCGITGVFHGLVSFTIYNSSNILSYFLTKSSNGSYSAEFNLNALSNVVGVLAFLIMLALLVTSNNLSMRYLKGKSWKYVQRLNYPLIILVVVHTIGYLVLNLRESFFTFLLTALVIFTILSQLIGILITIQREGNQAKAAIANQTKKTPTLTEDDLVQNRLARRRFLVLTGATFLTGVGTSAALIAALNKENSAKASVGNAATTSAGSGTVTSGNSTASTTVTTISGTKILGLSSLPTNSATNFTTPDTNETAILIHEQDGSVKAFSNICTHRPYNLVYQANSHTLFCALHSANFDAKTGAVLNGPPPTAVKSFNVQVDAQGNVVYFHS
jgi:DMSO/TMAO reductase YedYZ heme-binding membrane subunit/nitrite reductase/ring-hydroxylating ferredoxin subunit